MARRDKYHEVVVNGLEREGWKITHDPYFLAFGDQKLQVDIGAEGPIGAERNGKKIAVEIKSFLSASTITDFYSAYGQFDFYRALMKGKEPDRLLYLAMPNDAYNLVFGVAEGGEFRRERQIPLIIYDPAAEETALKWIE